MGDDTNTFTSLGGLGEHDAMLHYHARRSGRRRHTRIRRAGGVRVPSVASGESAPEAGVRGLGCHLGRSASPRVPSRIVSGRAFGDNHSFGCCHSSMQDDGHSRSASTAGFTHLPPFAAATSTAKGPGSARALVPERDGPAIVPRTHSAGVSTRFPRSGGSTPPAATRARHYAHARATTRVAPARWGGERPWDTRPHVHPTGSNLGHARIPRSQAAIHME